MKIFPLGGVCEGPVPATVNLGPPRIWESIRARKLKFYTHLDTGQVLFSSVKIFPLGACEWRSASSEI